MESATSAAGLHLVPEPPESQPNTPTAETTPQVN